MDAWLGYGERSLLLAGTGVLILCLGLLPGGVQAQTTVYDEDFSSYSVGDTSPGDGSWERDISGADLSEPNVSDDDYFSVRNPSGNNLLFEGDDLDGEAIWLTDTLDISSYSSVDLSLTADQNGTHESTDYFDVEYSTDGGASYTLITDWNGNGSSSHTLTGDWPSQTVSKSGVSGSSLILRVTMNNNADAEQLRLDDVSITGNQNPIVQFTEAGFTVNEGDGSTNLLVEIRNPDGNSVDVDVDFDGTNSSAGTGDIGNYSTTTVSFPSDASDGDTRTVSVDLTDDTNTEGLETAQFDLTNLSTGGSTTIGPNGSHDLDIKDNDISDIAVVEVMQNPDDVSDSDGEWFEVYNSTTSSIDLNSWTIGDAGGTDHTIGASVTVPAKGFAVLCANTDTSANGGVVGCDYAYSGVTLSNSGDEIILNNDSGTEIDRVEYDGGTNWPAPTGASMVFTGTALNNNGSKWTTASARARSYPGTSGSDTGSPGRNGEGQDVQPSAAVDGNAGWRMLSVPVTSRTVADLAKHNYVEGISGLPYSERNANVYTGWDGSAWVKPSSSTTLTSGRGFIWYFFDTAKVVETDPLPFTISARGTQPSGNVQVTGLTDGQTWHVLGNPYPTTYDISSLNLTGQGFQSTVQIWNPSANSYETVTQSTDDSDLVAAWQGFFVERSSDGNTTLTFDDAGKSTGDPIFYQRESVTEPARVKLRLVGRDERERELTRDEGAMAYFRSEATTGWDVWDASKLTPLATPYALLVLEGREDGDTVQQAVRSLPRPLPDSGYTVPIALNQAGTSDVTTYTVSWPSLKNVPDGWTLTFTDTEADTTIDLREDRQYQFGAEAEKKKRASSPKQTPDPRPAAPKALSKRSGSARFTLRVVRADALPVELASVEATVSGKRAVLTWETISETENAGFEIQHKVDGRFQRIGFVEGAGTTEKAHRYRYRTDGLSVGQHTFRLVQRDIDGTSHPKETIEVDIGLQGGHMLRAPYPNPFRRAARVEFAVKEAQTVELTLYNTLGQRVRTLYRGSISSEEVQRLSLEGDDLASGVYFLRMRGETFVETRRVTHVQ